ncbi:acyltransferase [Microbacterium sp. Sa4CUA7]|uniref:Acyltransferase n=2 Tax=Microbacterium pullorum TaxID=2762236 RepID=A0ABR8S0G0_9MICO|nr:acyltransferase [Microbacterium pullorum]
MLAAHLLAGVLWNWTDPATWTAIADGRSSILFATLAGVSIGIVTGGVSPLTGTAMRTARGRLAVRAGVLYLIGIVLIATGVPVYVILPAYAVLFLLGIPFTGLGARALLLTAAGVALTMPFVQAWLDRMPVWATPTGGDVALLLGWHYPFPVWIAFILAGMGLARADLGETAVQLRMLAAGAAGAIVGYGLDAVSGASEAAERTSVWGAVWTARPHSSGILEVVGSGGFAIAAIAVCLLLCRTPLTWVVLPLRAAGAMPLTAYVAQLLVWAIWAAAALGTTDDLFGFRALAPFWPITLGILGGATAWALLLGRGPLERLVAWLCRVLVPGQAADPR